MGAACGHDDAKWSLLESQKNNMTMCGDVGSKANRLEKTSGQTNDTVGRQHSRLRWRRLGYNCGRRGSVGISYRWILKFLNDFSPWPLSAGWSLRPLSAEGSPHIGHLHLHLHLHSTIMLLEHQKSTPLSRIRNWMAVLSREFEGQVANLR